MFAPFDLKNASFDDYQSAYADLAQIGLSHVIASAEGRRIRLPTTTCAGELNGASASAVRDSLTERIKQSFAARGFSSEIFSVGERRLGLEPPNDMTLAHPAGIV